MDVTPIERAAAAEPLRHDRLITASSGPTVVLLPGLFAGDWLWRPTWSALAGNGVAAVLLLDPLAALEQTAHGLDALRDVTQQLLDRLELGRIVLCGNSLGAL